MNRTSLGVVVAVSLGFGLCLPSVAEAGGKLVQMKNGRVLRAESVRTEGGELVVTLGGGHTMAFPAGAVAGVEDDLAATQIAADPLNVIRSGREGGSPAGFAPPMQPQPQPQPEPAAEEAFEAPVEAPPPSQDPNASPGVVIDNQAGAAGAAVVTPGPGTRNRRVGRLGFKARPADN